MKKKKYLKITAAVCTLAAVGALFAVLLYFRIIKLNDPGDEYPVKGVDVSSYQGDIEWNVLSEDLDFVFIKATEGSKYCDGNFDYNYTEARKTPLCVGAYHFFSFESGGKTQAENFIRHVEPHEGMLPPAVDVELYGEYRTDPKPAEEIVPELRIMLDMLEDHYGVKPVIYATGSAYNMYIADEFSDYDLWIRDVYFKPDSDWTFWQHSDTGRLEGYDGEEKHIDLNVFNGSRKDFDRYISKK